MTSLWFDNPWLSAIIAVALIINMLIAAIAGIVIPVLLNKMGIDPALAGSVILTTVTDGSWLFCVFRISIITFDLITIIVLVSTIVVHYNPPF
ncbi:magnesium transporter [uncultured Paraglaciecola sp.]|uniref:magnesium transporter n=1 Tax=uncultured Paraglaciecola sp. TaxID=1765024 RepID=UPI002632976A|nr:magnesium transporter [uncultured Paraglaciecola sp.]